GLYKVQLNTMDKAGKAVTLEKLITVYDFDAPLPVKAIGWTYQDARTYEPGETAQLYAGSSLKNQPMLFEMERNGQLLYSKWIKRTELESLEYKIEEADRGNVHYHLSYAGLNRSYHKDGTFSVPWTNKMLQIEYLSFRDKLLPGQEEEWQVKLKGPKSEKVAAEMVAAMYDASLDAFASHNWYFNVFPSN
ncbi:MAG: hypothetical protein KDC44_22690, partial [Phaeodactylibacter sp.]|nr:hypothetical protein [Phaeodactylibacter sp.]